MHKRFLVAFALLAAATSSPTGLTADEQDSLRFESSAFYGSSNGTIGANGMTNRVHDDFEMTSAYGGCGPGANGVLFGSCAAQRTSEPNCGLLGYKWASGNLTADDPFLGGLPATDTAFGYVYCETPQ